MSRLVRWSVGRPISQRSGINISCKMAWTVLSATKQMIVALYFVINPRFDFLIKTALTAITAQNPRSNRRKTARRNLAILNPTDGYFLLEYIYLFILSWKLWSPHLTML